VIKIILAGIIIFDFQIDIGLPIRIWDLCERLLNNLIAFLNVPAFCMELHMALTAFKTYTVFLIASIKNWGSWISKSFFPAPNSSRILHAAFRLAFETRNLQSNPVLLANPMQIGRSSGDVSFKVWYRFQWSVWEIWAGICGKRGDWYLDENIMRKAFKRDVQCTFYIYLI
jgi:hypothetical protein